MKPLNKVFWIVFFAIAMGYLETSVVVYLRALYYPEGFAFPMKAMNPALAVTELYREAATIIMILSVSILVTEKRLHRFAWFLLIFAIWDIAYYVFLKILLGWPESLFTNDILFLLPSLWTGPVIAPVINSIVMILVATAILYQRNGLIEISRLSKGIWILLIGGAVIVLIAYLQDFAGYVSDFRNANPSVVLRGKALMMNLSSQFEPGSFNWMIFGVGVMMHLIALYKIVIRRTMQIEIPNK
jgi:hypothetical protein